MLYQKRLHSKSQELTESAVGSASLEVSKLEFQLKQHEDEANLEDMTRRRWFII